MDNIFYNSEILFIEYMDILKSPYIKLMQIIQNNDKMEDIFDFSQITGLGELELYEWSIHRKNRNPLKELLKNPDISDLELDNLFHMLMHTDDRLFELSVPLYIYSVIPMLYYQKMVKRIMVYYEHESQFIRNDISKIVDGYSPEFVSGDFEDIVRDMPIDVTYILSDIDKITALININRLDFSTVIIPQEYRYNKKNMVDYKLDFTKLDKTHVYKYGFMKTM